MKQIISWDLDGVIANCQVVMINRMNKTLDKMGINHKKFVFEEYDSWNYAHDEIYKYTKDQKIALKTRDLFDDQDFLYSAEIYPDTNNFFEKLSKLDIENQIITSRPTINKKITKEWLKKYNISKYIQKLNIERNEDDGREYKIKTINKISPILHFDDDERIVRKLEQGWLIDRPWNKSATDLDYKRLKNWEEVMSTIAAAYRK